jgi:hypothetical protein
MRRLRRTKIVATLGPASSDRSVIASLFTAGADVFRINMSHTTHERMRELVSAILFRRSANTVGAGARSDGRAFSTPGDSSYNCAEGRSASDLDDEHV